MGEQLGPPDEAPESVAAATFRRAYEQATQLREMRERARDIYRTSPVDSFSGLSALLEMLLPKVDVIEERVAGGVGLSLAALRQLGVGAVSPFHLPPDAVVRLARAAELSFDQLVDLSVRDDLRLRSLSVGSPRHASSRRTTKAALGRLRESWDDLVAQGPPDDE